MAAHGAASREAHRGFFGAASDVHTGRTASRLLGRAVLLAGVVSALAAFAPPRPAAAWWHGPAAYGPRVAAGYGWSPEPWVPFPIQRPRPDYRYSVPPGAPLSYDDPASGTTYCWSRDTGFYFVCAYNPPPVVSARPVPPSPPLIAPPSAERTTPPASGVLMFQLPPGARASINGVTVGLSDGFGVHALSPGAHRVVLDVAGKETAHTVNVLSHRIFKVTAAGIVATEP